jgi:hypothetical protein
MNVGAGSLEFAHARIWARWGARADEAQWRRIELTRDLAAVLDLARAGALARWVADLGPGATPHMIEHALRRQWRERVAELASWMPAAWQDAIDWCGLLVDLLPLQHLARGATPPAWCGDDARLRPLLAAERAGAATGGRAVHDPQAEPLRTLLEAARADPQRLPQQWLAGWRQRAPDGAGRAAIEHQLMPLLAQHSAAFGAPDAVDGWALRRALHARLVMLLRRALVEPIAAFAYLILTALEGERLRAELIARAAFPRRAPAS